MMISENISVVFSKTSVECRDLPAYGIELSDLFKDKCADVIKRTHANGYTDIIFDRGSVVLYSGTKVSYMPTVGFIVAKTLVPYLQLLFEYKEVCTSVYDKATIVSLRGQSGRRESVVSTIQRKIGQVQQAGWVADFLINYDGWGGGKTIDRGDFYVSPLMKCAGLQAESQSAIAEFAKFLLDNPQLLHALDYSTIELSFTAGGEATGDAASSSAVGENILLYGVPGSGKSWVVSHEYCSDEQYMERIVFHPDYTYSDFVGQILPKANGSSIDYRFTPGPFTRILKDAVSEEGKKHHHYLVIEEINRGNAPAIFGDIFQLLDRHESGPCKGQSVYGISNEDIAKEVHGDATKKVKIPANVSIIGTMNTSDQNVFTLDTAFQRRWKMRLVKNDLSAVKQSLANAAILDTALTWRHFVETINNLILNVNAMLSSTEDKRLGAFFVTEGELKFDEREKAASSSDIEKIEAAKQNGQFAQKVLKYLWDDAFKFNRSEIFETSKFNSLEEVVSHFQEKSGEERFSVFTAAVLSDLFPDKVLEKVN